MARSSTADEMAARAAAAPARELEPFFRSAEKEVLLALARNRNLGERELLRLLERRDLPPGVVAELARHEAAQSSAAVRLAVARHPRAPRRVSLPLLKFLFLFDLVKLAQTPAVPADVKIAAEEMILKRAESLPRGERMTLARRGPGRVAAALLNTADSLQIQAALENPYLTEALVLKALSADTIAPIVVETIARNEKWSRRYALRLRLVRHSMTPFHVILGWLPSLAAGDLREVCQDRRMPDSVRRYLLGYCAERLGKPHLGSD